MPTTPNQGHTTRHVLKHSHQQTPNNRVYFHPRRQGSWVNSESTVAEIWNYGLTFTQSRPDTPSAGLPHFINDSNKEFI
ncbi:hypothetical protein Zmor_003727 [Zophobas morio]|uniref:Uncharacterized protein n=1 Tax=Zophobas morio TaxID=2755281 RepID=A0AA38M1L2_9CUCU|nr:hypothetical protein Zmor_003727 [Zophobas morio]